jgi:hypothetical protein
METNPTVQSAPYPALLKELVDSISYRPGWTVSLEADYDRGQGCRGLTLNIMVEATDSDARERKTRVLHLMPVPAAAYNKRSWRRWVFEQILLVERHEACEFFTVDGVKPYAPRHAAGNDPYIVFEDL